MYKMNKMRVETVSGVAALRQIVATARALLDATEEKWLAGQAGSLNPLQGDQVRHCLQSQLSFILTPQSEAIGVVEDSKEDPKSAHWRIFFLSLSSPSRQDHEIL